ncbi:MAG TPA: phosphoglucosamine mutase [Pyrinomonadaceae bacterium]|nr:phosphoglucosamine mutase [Pyrinomonadaceae bacterium]
MKKLFGTDGIRGIAGEFPLDESTVSIIGRSLSRQYKEKLGRSPRFVTGRDTRESGEAIERAFHSGVGDEGGLCESSGVITTPGVAFVTKHFEFDAGIVISASHNPYQDNGIKIFAPDGKKVGEDAERAIERDIAEASRGNGRPDESEIDDSKAMSFQSAYADHLASEYDGARLDGFRTVIDCANGAASSLAPKLFRGLGAEVIAFNDQPDGRNINKDCGSLHLGHLQQRVVSEKANFGVAFDGDADRALFVDEHGNIVDGDATLWIMAQFLRSKGGLANKTVVATVMSNIGLEIALASVGLKLVRTAVGDKYVLDELIRTGSELGGEQSGHVIFPAESLVGDGMMTALFMLEAINARSKPLSEMVQGFTRYPQVLVNVEVREKQPFENVAEISKAARAIEDDLDQKGRLLLRYSGTENLARVMIEGKDQAEIERQANSLAHVIRTALG